MNSKNYLFILFNLHSKTLFNNIMPLFSKFIQKILIFIKL